MDGLYNDYKDNNALDNVGVIAFQMLFFFAVTAIFLREHHGKVSILEPEKPGFKCQLQP